MAYVSMLHVLYYTTGPPGLPGMNCSCDLTGRGARAAGILSGSKGTILARPGRNC